MYVFLFIALLALGGTGYYEYNILEDKVGSDDQKILRLNASIEALQSDKRKLEDQNIQLTKTVSENQSTAADLTAQVQAARQQLTQAQSNPPSPATTDVASTPGTGTSAPAKSMTSVGNKLGQVVTRDGKTYQEARLLKVEADGIVINHASGIMKVAYNLLPDDLQKRFGFDPKAGPDLPADRVVAQEQLRQTAESASN